MGSRKWGSRPLGPSEALKKEERREIPSFQQQAEAEISLWEPFWDGGRGPFALQAQLFFKPPTSPLSSLSLLPRHSIPFPYIYAESSRLKQVALTVLQAGGKEKRIFVAMGARRRRTVGLGGRKEKNVRKVFPRDARGGKREGGRETLRGLT